MARARYAVPIIVFIACTTDDPVASTPNTSTPIDAGSRDTSTPEDASTTTDADATIEDAGTYANAVLADAPVAYWRLSETSGTTAKNAAPTGSAYDLTLSAGFAAGDLGRPGLIANEPTNKALLFTGNSSASVPINDATSGLRGSKAFTVEAWVRMPASPDGSADAIFATKDPANTTGYIFFVQAGGTLGMPVPTKGFYGGTTVKVPFDDQPHHVAVVWEGAGSTATFYVDGATEQVTGVADASVIYTSPMATVGALPPGDGSRFHGVLDEIAIYDKALPVARLVAHRAAAQ